MLDPSASNTSSTCCFWILIYNELITVVSSPVCMSETSSSFTDARDPGVLTPALDSSVVSYL